MKELTNVFARDPHGFINEIFKPGVAGNNLIEGLLMLVNEVKNQQKIPDIFQFANITSFFKGKGNKFEMDNDKGVFGATIFRYIIDKLIYNQEYKNIDENLNDSNIGARKERNIRHNLFVVYGIINLVMKGELSETDIQLYDILKCFDKLWLEETLENFVLLYKLNQNNSIAVKTPYGLTERFNVHNNIMQGTVFGPLACTTSISKLGDIVYKSGKPLIVYKDTVQVPTLGMKDDICIMSKCGIDSVIANSVTNSFIK